MILAAKHARAFQRPQIGHVFHDAQHCGVAPRIAAQRAGRSGVEIAADFAGADGRRRFAHGSTQRFQQCFALLEQHQRGAPRRARTQPRQFRQQLNETLDF
jgi:hypothetical protein